MRTKVICSFIATHRVGAHSVLTNNKVNSENVCQTWSKWLINIHEHRHCLDLGKQRGAFTLQLLKINWKKLYCLFLHIK